MASDLVVDTLISRLISLLNDSSLIRERTSQNIVTEIKSSFSSEDRTKTELDVALSVLFRTENSLLEFISRGCCEKSLKGGVRDSLSLIIDLLIKYEKELVQYFVAIKDVCFNVVTRNCVADVHEKAYQVIKFIVSSHKCEQVVVDLQIPALIEFLHCRGLADKSIKSSALQGVYEVYGAIAFKHPNCCSVSRINSLVRSILQELNTQMRKTNNVKPCVIEGCMNALKGVLKHFTRGYDENRSESKEIYSYVRDACAFKEDARQRVFQRAALGVFTDHIEQLWGWIVEGREHGFWLRDLPLWQARSCKEDRVAGRDAMDAFHKTARCYISENPDSPMKNDFMLYYRSALANPRAAHQEITLAIQGFCELSDVFGRELEDVSFMFRVILQRAQTDLSLEEESKTENDGDHVAKYLEWLSRICVKLRSVTGDQLSALVRLWRLAVERYPHHYYAAKTKTVTSLTNTILNMGLCDMSVFDRFLYSVVYQSIAVTCSHSLVEEAELQEELTGKEVVTYRNYLPLWRGLFNVGYENSGKVTGVTRELRSSIVEKLYDCFIKSLIAILDKLNVRYKRDDNIEVEIKSDPESSLKGEVPEDHSVLCNLANLCRELLANLDRERLARWVAELLTTVINHSVTFPLVSAFYKLLAAVLNVAQRANIFTDESEETQSLGLYVVRFLEDVMLQCKQYKNDLQASCLLAIISVPIPLIDSLLAGIAPVMQIVFQLGQTLLSIAHDGMAALELWQRRLPADKLRPILHEVLPLFDPYLRSRGITTELPEDEEMQMSKRQQQRDRRIQEATQLAKLQKRMLRLLSLLDSVSCLRLLKRPSDITVWSAEPTLTFTLPFPDQRFPVHLDPMLPRVVELALTSTDRQTKAAACEALHAFVIIFIGNGPNLRHTQESDVVSVLSRLVPPLLRLSCGSDLVARQLFHPMTLQLMHWFSSQQMLQVDKPVQTAAVVQAVWEGITNEEDTALQDFAALCLQEFMAWSIKQSSVKQLAKRPVGPNAIIRQISNYCLDTSLSKRRGAALAFNHVAKLVREETSLVDRYWLQLMYHLVCNLERGGRHHDHPAAVALDQVLKVIKKNAGLFNKESKTRKVPAALGSGTLGDVLQFLLQKCGSTTALCAAKCREMFVAIIPLVPDLPRPDQMADMVTVCEGGGGNSVLPIQLVDSDADRLRACIDCYAWSIKKGFISPSVAVKPPSRFVPCAEYFINLFELIVVPTALCSRQDSELIRAKCAVVVALFDLVAMLGSHIKDLPYTFFGNKFWKLLSVSILKPHKIGIDWRNQSVSSSLTDKLRLLLCTLRDNLDPSTLREMYTVLSEQVLYDCTSCVDRLGHLCQGLQHLELKDKQYIDGLITLNKTDVLQHLQHGLTWNGNQLVNGVFSSVFNSEGLPLYPETSVQMFADRILFFAVLLGAEVRTTLDCIMDRREVNDPHSSTSATTTKGQHFLNLFEDRLIGHLLQDPDCSVSRLVNQPSPANVQIIIQMLSASKYSKVKFNRSAEALLSSLTTAWGRLEAWAGPRQTQLVPLMQALVELLPPATVVGGLGTAPAHPAVSTWLYRRIRDPSVRLEYKADLVELLPSIISERTELQLEEVLRYLQDQFPLSSGELRTGSVERNTFVSVYTALLHTLVATGSITVLRVVCESAADKDHACSEAITTAVEHFIEKHNQEVQVQAMRVVYETFLDETKDVDIRLCLISRFLVPMLCKASKPAVTRFYVDTIQNIIDVFEEKLRQHDLEWKSKQQLARKIGACRMVESLFNRFEKTELENAANPVVKAATIPPGKDRIAKYMGAVLIGARKLNCSREELQELFQRFQCAAHNALTTFMCNTNQNITMCSIFLFKEDRLAPIWRKIVPTEPRYNFPIDFDDYSKIKKQLVQMRSLVQSQHSGDGEAANRAPALYLPSQSLFNSSLQEDITNFDFSLYSVRDADRMQQVLNEDSGAGTAANVDLEEDCLNNHECMPTLCAVVKHLCEAFPVSVTGGQHPQPPEWMEHLRASLLAPDQPANCRAFIVKLILNCDKFFKPFAHYWITPIIQCVLDNCVGSQMNYLVHDIVRILWGWHEVAIPNTTTEEKLKASEFVRILVQRTPSEQTNVLKYNIVVVGCLVEVWKSCLSIPYQELLDLIRPPPNSLSTSTSGTSMTEPGISLADVLLANEILPFNQSGKATYYEHLLVHLQRPERKIYKTCAYIIGKILRIVSQDGNLQGVDLQFFNQVQEAIENSKNIEHFIYCLHEIQKEYPAIVKGFEAQCISSLNIFGVFSVMLLDILTSALDFDFRNDAFSMLADLPSLIMNEKNPDLQVAALKLINKLMPSLTPVQMNHLLPSVMSLKNHKKANTRTVIYNIACWLFDNYRDLRDDSARGLLRQAKEVLTAGLADPDRKLQDKLYRFWTTTDRLSSQGWSRLVKILRLLYSPACESEFLPTTATLLLDLCQQTDEYKRSIFAKPLSDCVFEKYHVSGSYRTQHAALVPMFANTLSSQISSLSLGSFTDFNFQLRATQSPSSLYSATLQPSMSTSYGDNQSLYQSFAGPSTSIATSAPFGQKYKQGPSFGSDFLVPEDTTDGEPEPTSVKMLKKIRLVRDQKKVSSSFAKANREKNMQQWRHKAERQKRKEGEVTLMRGYRRGDLPDIQIPCSDIVTALTTLAKRDPLIARQLIVLTYKALVEFDVNTDIQGVSYELDHILQTSTSHDPSLVATVLEMGLVRPSACHSPANVITQVCKDSHQMPLGALLVEAKLMAGEDCPPPTKRVRVNPHNANYDDWMYLAEIYHSLEEKDVVQGLFEDKIADACSSVLREALQAEDQTRWMQALTKYTECLDTQSGTAAENMLYEASFKCAAKMSKWKELNESLKLKQLGNNMDEAWNDNWNRDHLLPWLFLSEIHRSQETTVLSVAQDFNAALSLWLDDPAKKRHIESKLSELLSVLLVLRGDSPRAKLVSDASVKQFLAAWQQLDTLNNHLRGAHLLGVHKLMDTERFLDLPPKTDADWSKRASQLLNVWNSNSPSKADSLVSWDSQAVFRNIFIKKLELQANDDRDLRKRLISSKCDIYMKTMECALDQENFYVARSYYNKIKNEMRGKASSQLDLCNSKVRLLRARLERDPTAVKVSKILEAWDPLEKLREQETLSYPLNRRVHTHTADVYSALLSVVQEQPSVMENLPTHTAEKLASMGLGHEDISSTLKDKVISSLEQAVAVVKARPSSESSVRADAYLRLTQFCHQIDDPGYRGKLTESLLRAMNHGSTEARFLFPCLLEPPLTDHADLFKSESKQVPAWMFLSWVAQLLAHLDTEIGHVVAPLLIELASSYPKALQFPFQLSKEMYKYEYPATRDTVSELSDLLTMDPATSKLLKGLSCVCQPHICLMYHMNQLQSVINQNLGSEAFVEAYVLMKNEAFPPDVNDEIKGKAFNDVKKFTDKLDEYFNQLTQKKILMKEFHSKLLDIYKKVHEESLSLKKERLAREDLASFSPWLANGYSGDVEIPGQYTGESKPLPKHHVTIAAFKPQVRPLDSMRWPTKITIVGNDGREHPYLVKFGEDLRQDQRIQQLFVLMNQLLSADTTASRGQLSIETYSVVPLNSRLGVIQWVDNTNTFQGFMIGKTDGTKLKAAKQIYDVSHFSRCNNANPSPFFQTVKKADSIQMYHRAVSELPPYMLRDAVLKMSSSSESFFHIRTVMLTNHACMSVCHWLLGIGDRHLSNTLVCLDSGRLLGIDFGHAFGTATQLISIPELMPFRLTSQILNLAAPLRTTGLIKETMVHTLRVLRENNRLLLATMKVFILEPSVDWLKAAKKHEACSTESVDWFPQQKISQARRKLEGVHPRMVTEEDLKAGHGRYPHYKKLLELLRDEGDSPHLRNMPEDGLSPRQQVECLIAQATNLHILSKTYPGWSPYL